MDFIMSIDWVSVLKIIGVDILLGGDNAIVIALACASLAPEVRNKAIAFGTAGAVLARILFLAIATWIMGFQYVKLFAGLYLFYIAYSLLLNTEEDGDDVPQKTSIWGAVLTVVSADAMMSLDNVLAVSSIAHTSGGNALYYAIFGIAISIPIIVYGSQLIIKIMDKYPVVIWFGGMLLGWVAVEMIISDETVKNNFTSVEKYDTLIKLIGFFGVAMLVKMKMALNQLNLVKQS